MSKHIVVIGGLPESLLNFRRKLLESLVSRGFRVTAIAAIASQETIDELAEIGVTFVPISIQRSGLNPAQDFKTFKDLYKKLHALNPDVVLAYTIKPVIWSGIALRLNHRKGFKFFALITGLGYAFQVTSIRRRLLLRIVTILYRFALKGAEKVIFQNQDSLLQFTNRNLIAPEKGVIVNGSGVDLNQFPFTPMPRDKLTFLSVGRLLGEKGFREYAKAAGATKELYEDVEFQIVGPLDPSPDAIPEHEIMEWENAGWITYLGPTKDVRPFISSCSVFVLASYHEGMSRSLMEAIAMGRPVLTTDIPGCREMVRAGVNGHLVRKADASGLTDRMIWCIENREKLETMGLESRGIAEQKFDVNLVNKQMFEAMNIQ